jgi:hypothetical protein
VFMSAVLSEGCSSGTTEAQISFHSPVAMSGKVAAFTTALAFAGSAFAMAAASRMDLVKAVTTAGWA